MVHAGSNRREPIAEFLVHADGSFRWRRRPIGTTSAETKTGKLGAEQRQRLVGLVEQGPSGGIGDDEGSIRFGWVDADGKVQSRAFPANDHPDLLRIVDAVNRLAETNSG